MGDRLVTVIIPAYNEEKTISRMLTCMSDQTYKNLEIIVVDDGSVDGTAEIVREYAAKDSRIKCVSKENGGVSSARNRGLDTAAGDYVYFSDADDYVPDYAIQNMVEAAESAGADLVIGQHEVINNGRSRIPKATINLSHKTDISRVEQDLLFTFYLANRLFRRSVIEQNHIRFHDYSNAEDGCFDFEFMRFCGAITGCPYVISQYIKKPFWEGSSLSQSISLRSIKDTEDAFADIFKIAKELAEKEEPEIGYRRYLSKVRRRALKACIQQYYRHIWELSDEALDEVFRFYDRFADKIRKGDLDSLGRQNADLDLGERLKDKQYYIDHPELTVIISGIDEQIGGPVSINDMVNGLYKQGFISFELLVDEYVYKHIHENHKKMENLHLIKPNLIQHDIRGKALHAARGRYILMIDTHTFPGTGALKEMCTSIGDADYICAPLIHVQDGSFEGSEADSEDIKMLANKLFRCSAVRDHKDELTKWVREKDSELPDSMTCAPHVENPFITGETI